MAKLTDSSTRLALLPPWYDVDTHADWHMLAGHVAAVRSNLIDALTKEQLDQLTAIGEAIIAQAGEPPG